MTVILIVIPILLYFMSIRFFLDSLLELRSLKLWQKMFLALFVILANYFCLLYTAGSPDLFILFLLNYIITFLFAGFLYKVKIQQLVLLCFIYSLLGMFTERIVYLFLFGGQTISVDHGFYVRIIVDIVLVVFTKIWQSYFKKLNKTIETNYSPFTMVLLPLISFVVLRYLITIDNNELSLRSLVECSVIFSLNLLVFILIDQISQRETMKSENTLYTEQLKYYEKYNNELEKHQLELDMKNHDFNNHLISISGYLRSSQNEELLQYINNIVLTGSGPVFTGSVTIDALLCYFQEKFKKENIEFQLTAAIPSKLPYKSSDLSVIIGNLLQNAYEELVTVTNQSRVLKLALEFDTNKLMIVIENPYQSTLKLTKNELFSTKKRQTHQQRGLGIKSVKKTLENYPHVMDIDTNDNQFTVTIIIFNELSSNVERNSK